MGGTGGLSTLRVGIDWHPNYTVKCRHAIVSNGAMQITTTKYQNEEIKHIVHQHQKY